LKFGIVLVGISLFLWSCQKESIINPLSLQQRNTEIQVIQQKFTLVNYQDSFIKNNLKVNWNNFVKANNMNAKVIKANLDKLDNNLSFNSSVTYEFSTNIQSQVSSTKDTTAFYSKTSILATIDKMSDSISFKIINYSSPKNKDFEHVNLNSLNNFNGSISFFDLNGKNLKMEAYKKGTLIQSIKGFSTNSKNISSKVPVYFFDTGAWVMATIFHYTDWYRGTTNPYTNKTTYTYKYSLPDGITYELVYVPTGYSGGGTYHSHLDSPHDPSTHIDNHPNEIIKDNSFLNTKADCVFNKLENLSIGFKNAIKKFDGEFPVSHLKFVLDNTLGNNVRAETRPPSNYIITIALNSNNSVSGVNYRPNLLTAKTIIHEVIHAEMFRKMLSLANTNGSISV